MSHLDAGTIVTIRDGGLVNADALGHLEACAACRSALADARDRAKSVRRALQALDAELSLDLETAKAAVRRGLDERREAVHRRRPSWTWALGRAAILLLAASGVVYALPGSPLRDWIGRDAAPDAVEPAATAEAAGPEGVELTVPEGGLHIELVSVGPGERVEVRWVDGSRAALAAGEGTRYAVASGRARADVASGPVRIGIPRDGGPVTIEVDGRTYLRSDRGGVEVLGDVVSRTAQEIVFTTGAR